MNGVNILYINRWLDVKHVNKKLMSQVSFINKKHIYREAYSFYISNQKLMIVSKVVFSKQTDDSEKYDGTFKKLNHASYGFALHAVLISIPYHHYQMALQLCVGFCF